MLFAHKKAKINLAPLLKNYHTTAMKNELLFPIGTPTTKGFYKGVALVGGINKFPAHIFQGLSLYEIPCNNIRSIASVSEVTAEECQKQIEAEREGIRLFYS